MQRILHGYGRKNVVKIKVYIKSQLKQNELEERLIFNNIELFMDIK